MTWSTFIYNKETSKICGQTPLSWLKLLTFYICFYIFLFSFWYLMLLIFLETVDKDRPNWAYTESLLKMNPGLSFRPRIPFDKADSSILIYNLNDSKSYEPWVDDLKEFLKPYKKARKQESCNDLRNPNCTFAPDFKQEENPCKKTDAFGYESGEPCILIKLNKIFFWKPSPYRSQDLPEDVNATGTALDEGAGLIFIECKGESEFDRDCYKKIDYWPFQGFPAEMYPFIGQKNYLSPFVFARLRNLRINVPISIECTAHDKNIHVKKSEKVGYFQFEIMINVDSNFRYELK